MDARMSIRKRTAVVLAATGLMLSVVSGAALAATVNGTVKPDNLVGTAKADTINGLDGKDIIKGLGGDDRLDGGFHQDIIRAGNGDDLLIGGRHQDELYGGSGDDKIRAARAGRDTVNCGSGVDTVTADSKDAVSDDCENVTIVPDLVEPDPVPGA